MTICIFQRQPAYLFHPVWHILQRGLLSLYWACPDENNETEKIVSRIPSQSCYVEHSLHISFLLWIKHRTITNCSTNLNMVFYITISLMASLLSGCLRSFPLNGRDCSSWAWLNGYSFMPIKHWKVHVTVAWTLLNYPHTRGQNESVSVFTTVERKLWKSGYFPPKGDFMKNNN